MQNKRVEYFSEIINIPIVNKAFNFGFAAHEAIGQKRKYNNEKYFNHCIRVTELVFYNTKWTPEMLAASLLHDVVEDTHIDHQTILEFFGPVVSNHVKWLTNKSKPSDGNRAKRLEIDAEHTEASPVDSQLIRIADIISNIESMKYCPNKKFALQYISEREMILNRIDTNNELGELARKTIVEMREHLNN